MPNTVYNDIAFRGSKKNIHNLIKEGLKNLNLNISEDLSKDFITLKSHTYVFMGSFRPTPTTFIDFDTTNQKQGREAFYTDKNGIVQKMFANDEEYEKYSRSYDEAVKYQKDTYGVVGWNDYNSMIAFGCKWDCPIDYLDMTFMEDNEDEAIIFLATQTPYSIPDLWINYLMDKFNIRAFICANEEFEAFNVYGEVGVNLIDANVNETLRSIDQSIYGSRDEYYNALYEKRDKILDDMYQEFRKMSLS